MAGDQDLAVPQGWTEALAAHGWQHAAANAHLLFFQRPGYWLRVWPAGRNWIASVMPESHRIASGTWPPPEFEPHELAPVITGAGARERALTLARELWAEHQPVLSELGIELWSVGVRQHRSSGGCGSSLGVKAYFRGEVRPEELPQWPRMR